MRGKCRRRVFCNHCRSYNHDTKACRKQHDNTPSPTHSQIATGYHPTVTPPPLMGTTAPTQPTQPTEPHNNPLFNIFDNNQPRTSTLIHTLHNGTSPATPADLLDGITQIMNRVTNDNKRDDASKKMMKNIKIFDGSNKAECITWLNQVEAAAKFTNTPFRELICQSMAPAMLHVFSDLSALASDADIKEAILTNYSDIPSSTEAATRLQNIQFSMNEPLVTFNHRYEAIHKVALKMSPNKQESKTVIVEYTKKLLAKTRDKLLRKIAKKNSYVKMLDDAFKQALDINRETSFVEAATGRYNNQNGTKIETQINELSDSFQEYDINAMNTRSTKNEHFSSPPQPMEFIAMDLIGEFHPASSKGNRFALTAVCMLTGFTFCIPLKSKRAEDVIKAYINHICYTFGPSRKILMDNGTEFKNKLWTEVFEKLRTEQKFTPIYSPQCNGRIEGFHKFLKATIAKQLETYVEWDDLVWKATAA